MPVVFTPHLRVYDLVVLLPVIMAPLPWESRWAQAGLILTSIGAIGGIGLVCIAVAVWRGVSTGRPPGVTLGSGPDRE